MAKSKSQFVCSSCGYNSPRWIGKCPECGSWNSFVEESITAAPTESTKAKGARAQLGTGKPIKLSDVSTAEEDRILTGIAEFDRVLGGGIMRGSLVLIGGDPGIGKSTLLLQLARSLLTIKTLYVSGEESPRQLKSRAERLSMKNELLYVHAETNIEQIIEQAGELDPDVLIIDSIQTMYRPMLDSAPGSVAQIRECTALLLQYAKSTNTPVFIVGHVTKDGVIAGPKVLEHIVDTVLQFEGERTHAYRILRAAKNRYGSTNEIGVFSMAAEGLVEVPNPSEVFLSERQYGSSGSCVCAVLEGTRPILLEVQALVSPTHYNTPQRTVTGYDHRRVAMLLAVIERRLGVRLRDVDVFINIAGGLTVEEPAVDLAIAMAVLSSIKDIPVDSKACVIGEIGLGGEVRAIGQPLQRVQEALRLGFERVIVPNANLKSLGEYKKQVIGVEKVKDASEKIL
ncbi:MAG TPA: DNA repair protein RadA [Candidatus Kapabacteria bacterium]|nr:DNA repair protein RadA [Candidatus Kapabacteria bacterium]